MSQSPSLSFGPAWMRPKLTKNLSQESTRTFSQNQQQQQQQQQRFNGNPSTNHSNGSKAVYSVDELLKVWSQIQNELQREGFEEKYRQLNPIRQLVHQVETDRQLQQLNQQQYFSNQHSNSSGSQQKRDDPQVALELTNQLNEINTWAKTENTGIDIAGIISNVTRSQSPFVSKPSLFTRDSSFASINSPLKPSTSQSNFNSLNNNQQSTRSFSSHFQPQLQAQPELIPPELINWYYLDPNGNKQGPFDGVKMQGWFTQGYLSEELQIRREDEQQFYLLKDFSTSIGNYTEPFLSSLPSLNPTNSLPHQFSNLSFEQQAIPGLFGSNDVSSSFINQPQAQIPAISNINSWSSSNLGAQQLSGRSSPWATQPSLSNVSNDFTSSNSIQSPFFTSTSTLLDQSNSFQNNGLNNTGAINDEEIFSQIQYQVFSDGLKDVAVSDNIPAQEQVQFVQEAPVEAGVAQSAPEPQPQVQPKQQLQGPEAVDQKNVEARPKKEIFKRQSQQQAPIQKIQPQPVHAPVQVPAQPAQPSKIITETSKLEPKKTSSASQLAPWAKKTSTPSTPTLTLDQIQQLEAEESKKQNRLKQEKDKTIAAQLLTIAEKSLLKEEKVNALPSSASWGSLNQSKAPSRTLLDIQREEAELEAAKAASLASLAKANGIASTNSGSSTIKTALPTNNSFASIASTSNTANAWTTVTTRKAAPKPPAPTRITSTSSKVTPDVLRSVSATAPIVSSTSSTSLKISPRQEFLAWCRSTIKLNKGINKDDVLQILLMLPTTGSESSEIIADTIYSNSSVMDGRRFAIEFLKRRKSVEEQVHDGLSWFDALNINPEDENDGWDFQVVGKKNKKRV